MRALIRSLNREDGHHVMVRAAMGHLNLVMVHPFSDGNGRMARCLQTLILATMYLPGWDKEDGHLAMTSVRGFTFA